MIYMKKTVKHKLSGCTTKKRRKYKYTGKMSKCKKFPIYIVNGIKMVAPQYEAYLNKLKIDKLNANIKIVNNIKT